MKKNETILEKSLNTLQTIKKEEERLDYLLYTLNLLSGGEKTLFFTKQQIPKRGLARLAWQDRTPFFINNIKEDERFNPRYDSYCEEMYAVLYYPVEYYNTYIGMIISIGKEGYTTTEEQIVPQKSGDKTIGVTVKKATVEIPPHKFSQEDIDTLDHAVPSLFEVYYGKTESKPSILEEETIPQKENTTKEEKSSLIGTTFNKMKQLFGSKSQGEKR